MAMDPGLCPTATFVGEAKLTGQVAGVVTVRVNVLVVVRPAMLKAVTVTVYVPAGCGSVIRTTPVAGLASSVPLKVVDVETVMAVVLIGVASGVTVVLELSDVDVSG